MKGSKLLLFDKSLSGLDRFALVWNAVFVIWCAVLAVAFHDGFQLFMMFFFVALFLWSVKIARTKRDAALSQKADKE